MASTPPLEPLSMSGGDASPVLSDRAGPPPPPRMPVFRFGLRQLFLLVAVICVLLALMMTLSGYSALALLIAVLVVAAHVIGTTIGSRLREHADRRAMWQRDWHIADLDESASRGAKRPDRSLLPPETSLRGREKVARWVPGLVIAGMVVGAIGGFWIIGQSLGDRMSAPGLTLATLSTAVLGGWAGFLLSSFWGIFRHAWRQASQQQRLDSTRTRRP